MVTSDQSAGFFRGYLRHLTALGWTVTLVADDAGRLEQIGRAEGVATVAVPMRRAPAPLHDLASLARLTRALRRIRPEVVVYATPKASLLTALAARLARVPARVYDLWGFRHETMSGVRRTLFRAIERLIGRLSTDVVAVSASLARLAEREGIATAVSTVGAGSALGVDVARFSREADDLPPLDGRTAAFLRHCAGRATVVFVGRVNRDKGVDTLLAAVQQLEASGRPVRCLVVGPHEDERLRVELEAAAARLPLLVVGPVADPRPYLAAADVLCLPTLREGFGQVVIEAAAMGVPAVATAVTGVRDAVVDGRTGLLVPVGDALGLAEALWQVASDRELAQRLGGAARERARRDFRAEVAWRLHGEHLDRVWSARCPQVLP